MLESLTVFKKFLFENFSNIGSIALICTVCLFVLSFALREVAAWFTKTDKIRSDLKTLKTEVRDLQEDIRALINQLSHKNESVATPVEIAAEEKPKKTSAFPLNH